MLRKSLIGMAAAATLALSMPALSTDASAHGWHRYHHHHYWHHHWGCSCHHHYWHRWYWGRTWGWGPWPWGWGGVGW
jgi:hypothetical protein